MNFSADECIKAGWRLFKRHAGLFLFAGFLVALVDPNNGIKFNSPPPLDGWSASLTGLHWRESGVTAGGVHWYFNFNQGFLKPFFLAGMYWMILQAVRGKEPRFADFFVAFTRIRWFVGILAAEILMSVLVILGLAALLLPGFYLMVGFSFVYLAIIDRNLGIWQSLAFSLKRIHPYWLRMLGLWILCFLVLILGMLCLLVGVLVAYPVTCAAIVYAYEMICGEPEGTVQSTLTD